MNDCMTFPDTVEEFMEQYKVVDTEHIYTNGSELVPIFRMKQWFEHMPPGHPDTTTHDSIPAETGKNDSDRTSGDCISRQKAVEAVDFGITYAKAIDIKTGEVRELFKESNKELTKAVERIKQLPSVQPERPKGRWIPTASEKGRHECSRCHEYAPCYQDGSEHLTTFCVLCGAKMESGEADE